MGGGWERGGCGGEVIRMHVCGGGENEGEENVVRIQLFALFDVLSVFLWRVTP